MNNISRYLTPKKLRNNFLLSATLALTIVATTHVQTTSAQTSKTITAQSASTITPIVELYTSQGCSSCPPADKWISKLGDTLSADFHAIPLAFHVDYWNYLGWQDPYSNPKFTKRQRTLAANNKQRTIYTPEFLVSGTETRGTTAVVKAIQQANQQPAKVQINLTLNVQDNGELKVNLLIDNQAQNANLYLAISENNLTSEIATGENHGKTLTNDYVVRYFNKAAILQKGEYQNTHMLQLQSDWDSSQLSFSIIVLDQITGKTLQTLSTQLIDLI